MRTERGVSRGMLLPSTGVRRLMYCPLDAVSQRAS